MSVCGNYGLLGARRGRGCKPSGGGSSGPLPRPPPLSPPPTYSFNPPFHLTTTFSGCVSHIHYPSGGGLVRGPSLFIGARILPVAPAWGTCDPNEDVTQRDQLGYIKGHTGG